MTLPLVWLSCLSLWLPVAAPKHTAAVLTLEAKNGVSPDVAELLTSNLVSKLGDSGRFSRLVGFKEAEALLGYEQKKQMLQCDQQGCLAELAGALGVDFLVFGTIGRLGKTWLFNVSMLSTTKGEALTRFSRSVTGEEDALIKTLDAAVAAMLGNLPAPEGQLVPLGSNLGVSTGARVPEQAPGPQTAPPEQDARAGEETTRTTRPAGLALLGVGGGMVALGLLGALAAAFSGGVGVLSAGALMGGALLGRGRLAPTLATGTTWGGAAGVLVGLVGGMLVGVVGITLLVTGMVLK